MAATDLVYLDLAQTSLKDLSPLASLTKLETLRVNDSLVEDISVLKSLTQLKRALSFRTTLAGFQPHHIVNQA